MAIPGERPKEDTVAAFPLVGFRQCTTWGMSPSYLR